LENTLRSVYGKAVASNTVIHPLKK